MAPNVNSASTDAESIMYPKNEQIYYKKPNLNTKQKIVEDLNNNEDVAPAKPDYSTMLPAEIGTDYNYKRRIVWFNAIGFAILHAMALYGLYLVFNGVKSYTLLFCAFLTFIASEGVTIGAHRMYSHKALKANFITRLGLVLLQTMAGQNCMYIWVRDHRQHHKFSDTDADPHNANRGFFFSHIGWLMARKHPAVIAKGRSIDMSDLEADGIVMWQKLFYKPLYVIFAIAIPVAIPVYLWEETYWNSFFVSYMLRYILQLNGTWLVNSYAHMWGYKPYDKKINPVETRFVDTLSFGEGWHNYHHAFPWDYRAAELGIRYSPTTFVIDTLAKFGMVYDLKTASSKLVQSKIENNGDGTHPRVQVHKKHDGEVLYDSMSTLMFDDVDEDLKGREPTESTSKPEQVLREMDSESHKLATRGY